MRLTRDLLALPSCTTPLSSSLVVLGSCIAFILLLPPMWTVDVCQLALGEDESVEDVELQSDVVEYRSYGAALADVLAALRKGAGDAADDLAGVGPEAATAAAEAEAAAAESARIATQLADLSKLPPAHPTVIKALVGAANTFGTFPLAAPDAVTAAANAGNDSGSTVFGFSGGGSGGPPFLCTQSAGGALTHFAHPSTFYAVDFRASVSASCAHR